MGCFNEHIFGFRCSVWSEGHWANTEPMKSNGRHWYIHVSGTSASPLVGTIMRSGLNSLFWGEQDKTKRDRKWIQGGTREHGKMINEKQKKPTLEVTDDFFKLGMENADQFLLILSTEAELIQEKRMRSSFGGCGVDTTRFLDADWVIQVSLRDYARRGEMRACFWSTTGSRKCH